MKHKTRAAVSLLLALFLLIGALPFSAFAVYGDDEGAITYTTGKNAPIEFDAEDFSSAFHDATGDDISFVVFELPSTSYGKLYYNYISATEYDSIVYSDMEYYVSEFPSLSNISFVPAADFIGLVVIDYTAYGMDDSSYEGKIVITVENADEEDEEEEEEEDQRFSDVGRGHIWAKEAIEYLFDNGIITGDGKGRYNPSASISRGDFILMLCRAFDLSADSNENFSDVEEGSYYYKAIAIAKQLKIAKGSGGRFNPRSSLSRQDAMVLIVRAMVAVGISLPAGDQEDLETFSDSSKISGYAVEAVAALVKAGFIRGSDGKLNPKASVSRAEMAVILHRVLTD